MPKVRANYNQANLYVYHRVNILTKNLHLHTFPGDLLLYIFYVFFKLKAFLFFFFLNLSCFHFPKQNL